MKTCPRCGFHHSDQDVRCVRCGTYLTELGAPDPLAAADQEVFDFTPGQAPRHRFEAPGRLLGGLRRRLFIWRERLRSPLPEDVNSRNPWLAGWLSLVPGLGQLYNHQPKKAALMFGFVAIIFAVALLTLYNPYSNYILLVYLLAMMYSFHDALITAKQINRDYLTWQHTVAFYFAWILYVCLFSIAVQFFGRHFLLKFRYIADDAVAPVIHQGERIAIDCFSYLVRDPRPGDIVYYNPPMLTMEQTSEVASEWFLLDPMNAIERVVAGPGQTFERRGGAYYRDGQPVGPREQPLIQDQITWDYKLTAPPDGYIVLFSYTFGYDIMTNGTGLKVPAPKLNASGFILQNWPQACTVKKNEIIGRVWFVYNPPPGRRLVSRWPE